jgi:putative tricarboxylic transport membrane protein
MKQWKRALSVLMLVFMVVSLAACGQTTTTTSPTATTAPASDVPTPAGDTGDTATPTTETTADATPTGAAEDGAMTTSSGFPNKALQIMAPANPGGGWDITARTMAQVLQEAKLVPVPVEVYNKAGAGGTVGLAELVNAKKGDPYTIMMMGRVMLGAVITNKSPVTLKDVTPLARLISENEVIVVPKNSPHKTMADLVNAMKADPKSVTWAGGSAGGTDHILVGQIALAAGVDPAQINYVPYSGGGEATAAVLGGQVTAGVSGYGEWEGQIESGEMRALAISGEKRIEGVDIPTLKEAGTDVVLLNWRGVVGPPGIGDEEKKYLQDMLTKMHDSEQWKAALAENKWDDVFMTEGFDSYMAEEDEILTKILTAVGLVK